MRRRVFAGHFSPGGASGGQPGVEQLAEALRPDGQATAVDLGALAVAWTPPSPSPRSAHAAFCLIDGRPDVARLADVLGLAADTPPGELAARGFQHLGADFVKHLNGDFALVAWDPETRRGLLARDHLGARPLFWTRSRGALLFASEVRNLLALLPARPAPDPDAVVHWLARTRGLREHTLHRGIERLLPAHGLAFDEGGIQRPRRYWQPHYVPPAEISVPEATERVRVALEGAVARSLEGVDTAAVMLSGGLDSAMVAAAAPDPLPAYSAVFPHDPAVDESERIAQIRRWLGLRGVEQHFAGASALAAGADFISTWDAPSVTPNLFIWLPLLRRAAADGVDVVLDGEGGDELFGCARYLVADRLRSRGPVAALRVARRLPGMGDRPRPIWLVRALTTYGLRAALPRAAHEPLRAVRSRSAAAPGWLAEDGARAHRAHDDPWAWKRTAGPRWWAELSYALTVAGDALGAPDQLRREGLMAGVELRHPLRDLELIQTVLGLPPELAFHPRTDRPLARAALAGMLPAATLDSDSKPAFNSLLAAALEGPDAAELRELLSDPHPELARRVRIAAARSMLERPDRGAAQQRSRGLDLWRLASIELWLRHEEDPGSFRSAPGLAQGAKISFTEVDAPSRQLRGTGPEGGWVPN